MRAPTTTTSRWYNRQPWPVRPTVNALSKDERWCEDAAWGGEAELDELSLRGRAARREELAREREEAEAQKAFSAELDAPIRARRERA